MGLINNILSYSAPYVKVESDFSRFAPVINNSQEVKPRPIKSKHGIVNPLYNRYVNEIFNEYKGLGSFSTPSDYLPMDANGEMLNVLNKNKYGLEFQNKGEKDYQVGDDKLQLDNIDKHRIYINPNMVNGDRVKDAIKLDMLSHAFHNNSEYNDFTNDLKSRLYAQYGQKTVDGNDGVDGYVRGYLSNSPEYQPFKKELQFLPNGYFDRLDSIMKTAPKK